MPDLHLDQHSFLTCEIGWCFMHGKWKGGRLNFGLPWALGSEEEQCAHIKLIVNGGGDQEFKIERNVLASIHSHRLHCPELMDHIRASDYAACDGDFRASKCPWAQKSRCASVTFVPMQHNEWLFDRWAAGKLQTKLGDPLTHNTRWP
jgi:hypothetical protein